MYLRYECLSSNKSERLEMPVFECRKCGECCNFAPHDPNDPTKSKPFTIWGWEKKYLERIAELNNIRIKIYPASGVYEKDKMLVFWYILEIDGRCPFFIPNEGCSIHWKKPLMCSLAPYPDEMLSRDETWQCLYEKTHDIKTERKSWYQYPNEHLDLMTAYTAYIVRLVEEQLFYKDDIFPRAPQRKYGKSTLIKYKDIFEELTRVGILDPSFLQFMNTYTFSDLASIKDNIEKLKRNIKKIIITREMCDRLFYWWENSPDVEYYYDIEKNKHTYLD